ncbi:hypothetical protein BGZ76_010019 [Entomortierella beljakovae]|nr:hypothetical protein BGZ76_010019 [Entomortierella beljakovae]
MSSKVQRIMVQPIVHEGMDKLTLGYSGGSAITGISERFRSQYRSPVQIWLYEQLDTRIEGQIIGFDEFMNLVLDEAAEINIKKETRREIGRILLKGDNITLIQSASAS